jgi:two-component system chemotaxis sensor kinase CheA
MAAGGESDRISGVLREFIAEAEDLVETLQAGLAELGDALAASELPVPRVNELFRAAHSLKSLAGLFEVPAARDLAHRLEEMLDALRMGRVSDAPAAAACLAEGVAILAQALPRLDAAETPLRLAEATRALAQRFDDLRGNGAPAAAVAPAVDLDPAILRALTEYEEHRLRDCSARGLCIALADAVFELLSFEQKLRALSDALRTSSEIIATLPSPAEVASGGIRFQLLIASEAAPDVLGDLARRAGAELRVLQARAQDAPRPAASRAAPAPPERAADAAAPPASAGSLRSLSDTLRVDFRKLDALMNLVGELGTLAPAFSALGARVAALPESAGIERDFERVRRGFERKLRDLQAAVLDVRMVPLRQVFEKLARAVRGLERELHKRVTLEFAGGETELDKRSVEALADPLLHLVRNALDHALEAEADRVAAGKPPIGTIRVSARAEGRHVVVSVEDDGAGIDTGALREKAIRAGLLAADAARDERELERLVFEPGLSTRERATLTSGRGVGMDVVRANLSALGGRVDLRTERGRGTEVALTLPITLAILPALYVRSAGQRFALPIGAVRETLAIESARVQKSCDQELWNLRGEPLPLRHLADALGLPRGSARDECYAVVIGNESERVGLVVDELGSRYDSVIKTIEAAQGSLPGVAGAVEVGGEAPVLLLDVEALLHARRSAGAPA